MKAEELQRVADRNNMKRFNSGLKKVWGPQTKQPVHLKSSDGVEIFTDSRSVMARWNEYFQKLINVPGYILPEVLENIQKRSFNTALDEKPTMDEMVRAINGLNDGKARGGDGISTEVWNYGGANLSNRLHRWIIKIWEDGNVPQAWKDANIVTICKKGDRTECGNYRGISLLSAAGKIFPRTLLNRLSSHITPEVVQETHSRHDLLPTTTPGKVHRAGSTSVYCLCRLHEGIRHRWEDWTMAATEEI